MMDIVRLSSLRFLFAAGLAVAAVPPGMALTIEGLPLLAPLVLHDALAVAFHQRLEVRHADGVLRIQPWPDFLPPRFSAQKVVAERSLWPAGPSDRVTFTRQGEAQPWLIAGSRSRTETTVTGAWRLRYDETGWVVTDSRQTAVLSSSAAQPQAVRLDACGGTWDVYLLNGAGQSPPGSMAGDQEARVSWVAVRQDKRAAD